MINIRLIDNIKRSAHEDVFVTWQEMQLEKVVDSYFFVIDEGSIPEHGVFNKAATVLKHILLEWKSVIENIKQDETVYLPFDFSDEYIGYLKVTQSRDNLIIGYGVTRRFFGWNIDPLKSVPLPMSAEDEAFTNTKMITISLDDFVAQIEQNVQNLGS
ncbi:hypothetical protein [Fibrella aquatilis]|uniref:Uncharacterized protein n=1 Tax=Fibrella aquatilis TaxID=2817059 RepID=A0A939GBC0_9BACT|nr:hypothetical protein [Fibrella aquatilis]MBO0933546.1 hypothetical protein [Fibrella aquatilis]